MLALDHEVVAVAVPAAAPDDDDCLDGIKQSFSCHTRSLVLLAIAEPADRLTDDSRHQSRDGAMLTTLTLITTTTTKTCWLNGYISHCRLARPSPFSTALLGRP